MKMARIPEELKKAQSDFNDRYYCDFDIEEFSSRANGLMFLDPKNGWKDNYIMFFEEMYRKALKKAEEGYLYGFDSVKMLEDFENTLVMPYYEECIENKAFVNHRPYAGMERAECFEMLDKIHKESPSNPIEFYMDEYKSGKTSIRAMRRYTSIVLGDDDSVIAMNNEDFENGTKMNDKVKIAAGATYNTRSAIVVDDFCTDFFVLLTEVRSGRYSYRASNGLVDTTYIKAESSNLPSDSESLVYSNFSVSPKQFGKRGWPSFLAVLAAIVMAGAVIYGVYVDYFAVKRRDVGLFSWLTQLSAAEMTVLADDLAAEETVTVL